MSIDALFATVERWRSRPMKYGSTDCFQFAGEVVYALTGIDHRPKFGEYSSRAQADAILRNYGGAAGIIASALGDAKPAAFAKRGDLVTADFGDGVTVGVCLGLHICAPGPRGLVFIPAEQALMAWSV